MAEAQSAKATIGVKNEQQNRSRPNFQNPTEVITIIIGPAKTKFVVHKEFACHYSPVLKAALNSEFIEGQTQTYTIEEFDEATGRLFAHRLYSQDLEIAEEMKRFEAEQALAKLWILGDKLLIPRLQNQVLRKMSELYKDSRRVALDSRKSIYENTSKDSGLRKFTVHRCACYLAPETYHKDGDKFPTEMLLDLAAAWGNLKIAQKELTLGLGRSQNWNQYDVVEK